MKKTSFYGLGVTTIFNVSIGLLGYAALGKDAPGNILTGFYKPFWLVDFANIAVIVHLVGAYQVFAQPIYVKYEEYLSKKYPDSIKFHKFYTIPLFSKAYSFRFTVGKLVLRTMFVVFTTLVGMLLLFFNAVLGQLGSISFWPLTVYFPITLYIKKNKIGKGERKWSMLQFLSLIALLVSVLSVIGSVVDIGGKLQNVKLCQAGL